MLQRVLLARSASKFTGVAGELTLFDVQPSAKPRIRVWVPGSPRRNAMWVRRLAEFLRPNVIKSGRKKRLGREELPDMAVEQVVWPTQVLNRR